MKGPTPALGTTSGTPNAGTAPFNANIFETKIQKYKLNNVPSQAFHSQKYSIIGSVVLGQNWAGAPLEETFELIELLQEHGAELNEPTFCIITYPWNGDQFNIAAPPLFQALEYKNFVLSEYLISRGASTETTIVNGAHSLGFTPLLFAIEMCDDDSVRFLLANGADPANKGETDYTPLTYALMKGRTAIAEEIAYAIASKYQK